MKRFGLILIAVFMVACSSQIAMRENLRSAEYELKDFEIKNFPMGDSKFLEVDLILELKNPLSEPVRLDSIWSKVSLDSVEIGEIEHLDHVEIKANKIKDINIRFKSALSALQWLAVLKSSRENRELELKGKAWSQVEYFWFWDSLKESDFQWKKDFESAWLRETLGKIIQQQLQKTFSFPGGIIDPSMMR